MNKAFLCLSFVAGAAVGSLAAIFLTKDRFEKQANERADKEIESMKEYYQKKEKEITTVTNAQIEKKAYEFVASRYQKTADQKISETKNKEEGFQMDKRPYVIDPSEYGDLDYEQISLNYYDDGVLTYENDDVIENVDDLVGKDSLSHFGEFEADTVYVRNDELKIDFEILADSRRYEDIYC